MKTANGFLRVYPFATENINGYLSGMKLKDKSVLTVGSSLDQALNATLVGAKDITVLDINPNTEKYYELKKTALKELKRDEFIKFLHSEFFNKKYYDRVSNLMYEEGCESAPFWDELYESKTKDEIREEFFSGDVLPVKSVLKLNRYLVSDASYHLLKTKIDNAKITIKQGDIFKPEYSLDEDEKFDRIIYSNTLNYTQKEKGKNEYQVMRDSFLQTKEHLNYDGILQFIYLYSVAKKDLYQQHNPVPTYNLINIWNQLKGNTLELEFIPSVTKEKQDAVITYTKK